MSIYFHIKKNKNYDQIQKWEEHIDTNMSIAPLLQSINLLDGRYCLSHLLLGLALMPIVDYHDIICYTSVTPD